MSRDHFNAFFLGEPENQIIVREVDGVRFYDFPASDEDDEIDEILSDILKARWCP